MKKGKSAKKDRGEFNKKPKKCDMPKTQYQNLVNLLHVQSNSENEKLMVLYLDQELTALGLGHLVDSAGNVLVVKGKAKTYPCVVSHMDTVHDFEYPYEIFSLDGDRSHLFAKSNKRQVGIGGDDKCGVFACLYLLKILPVLKVVFFSREESGCKGSHKINKKFFDDCRYIIQLDRRGGSDFIQTYYGEKTISNAFSSEIGVLKKHYGFKKTIGTVTDCMVLWKGKVGISCVNISSGYYLPHTSKEYIRADELWHSIKFTIDIITSLREVKYKSLPPKAKAVTGYGTSTYNSYYGKMVKCTSCNVSRRECIMYDLNGKKFCFTCLQDEKRKDIKKDTNKDTKKYKCEVCGIAIEFERWLHKHENKKVCWTCKDKLLKGSSGNTASTSIVTSTHSLPVCTYCYCTLTTKESRYYRHSKVFCRDCAEYYDKQHPTNTYLTKKCELCDKDISNNIGYAKGQYILCRACADDWDNPDKWDWYCPSCKVILGDLETIHVVDGEIEEHLCAACGEHIQSYETWLNSKDRICSCCYDVIPNSQPLITKGRKEYCTKCAGIEFPANEENEKSEEGSEKKEV